jgi:cell division protein FtsQ
VRDNRKRAEPTVRARPEPKANTRTAKPAAERPRNARKKERDDLASDPRPSVRERANAAVASLRAAGRVARKPLGIVIRIAILAGVTAGAIAVGRLVERHVRTAPSFAIHELSITGNSRLSEELIAAAAGVSVGTNVFEVSPEEAEQRLEAVPWIAAASVHRRLPDRFEIDVRERTPVLTLVLDGDGDEAGIYLVSESGEVFKRLEAEDPIDLPAITGIDDERFTRDSAWRNSVVLAAVALLHDYRGAGLFRRAPIAEIHVETDDGLSLYAGDDPLYVRLGRGPYREKLRRLRTVLDRLRDEGTPAEYIYLDNVRRPDRVTVRLRPPPDAPIPPEPADVTPPVEIAENPG